jgi:transcriptional regulator with XRE-family HTH domain
MRNPEFRKEHERAEPDYMLVREILRARLRRKMTQQDLAAKVGTAQSRIARIEHANDNPSLDVIKRIAEALECRLELRFVPKRKRAKKAAQPQRRNHKRGRSASTSPRATQPAVPAHLKRG